MSTNNLIALVFSRFIKISTDTVAPSTTIATTEEEETTAITLTDGTFFSTATTDDRYSKVPFCSQSLIAWEYLEHPHKKTMHNSQSINNSPVKLQLT